MFIKTTIFLCICSIQVFCKDPVFTINGKKLLLTLQDEFVNFIVDYYSTLEFIAEGNSELLVQTLSSSTIRIVNGFPNLTSQEWNSLNDWISNTNLTPKYVISQSTALLPYLKANSSWELRYDCGNFNESILPTLREFINANPDVINKLSIVQSNLDFCFSDKNQELLYKLIRTLNYTTDVMVYEERFNINKTKKVDKFYFTKSKIPIWATLDAKTETLNFEETLLWYSTAEKLKRSGFTAVFKQTKLSELVSDSPMFWVTMFYKSLVGPKVLDAKLSKSLDFEMYAHCTKGKENSITIVAIGYHNQNFTVKLPPPYLKTVKVLSYVLASNDSSSTFLNGKQLEFDALLNGTVQKPKVSTLRVINQRVQLNIPSHSLGFFVIQTKISVCVNVNNTSIDEIPYKLKNNRTGSKTLNLELVYAKLSSEENSNSSKKIELKLTNDEIKLILLNRAKQKANEVNVTLTSKEIEDEIVKEVKTLVKRDINMQVLKNHSTKKQVNPAVYNKVQKHDLFKKYNKQLKYNTSKFRHLIHDDDDVNERYLEDNVKFLMEPSYAHEKNKMKLKSDIDEENVRDAVKLLEDYMEKTKNSEEIQDSYEFDHYRRFKRSSSDEDIDKHKWFIINQLRIIRRNPFVKINSQKEISTSAESSAISKRAYRDFKYLENRRFKRRDNINEHKPKRLRKKIKEKKSRKSLGQKKRSKKTKRSLVWEENEIDSGFDYKKGDKVAMTSNTILEEDFFGQKTTQKISNEVTTGFTITKSNNANLITTEKSDCSSSTTDSKLSHFFNSVKIFFQKLYGNVSDTFKKLF